MKLIFTTVTLILFISFCSYAQLLPCEDVVPGASCNDGNAGNDVPEDGNGSLGLTYSNTKCGLNYAQSSLKTTLRYATPAGTGFPATFTIAGIPACSGVLQSYLWWGGSGSAGSGGLDPSFTFAGFTGTASATGTGPEKCWDFGGTVNYRYDVTSLVTGNGSYSFTSAMGDQIDGATLMVIYKDSNATYEGNIRIHDGNMSYNTSTTANQTMTGMNVCANSTYGEVFTISGDHQDNQLPPQHTVVMNGTSTIFSNDFYNFDLINTTFTSGQTSCAFSMTPTSGDCYDLMLMGIYYQTTSCTSCSPICGNFLSVDVLEFTTQCRGEYTQIHWTTAAEDESDYYIVERSTDNKQSYTRIAEIDATGHGLGSNSYSFETEQAAGLAHYRLKEVDTEGHINYLSTIKAEACGTGESVASYYSNGSIFIKYAIDEDTPASYKLYDVQGRLLEANTLYLDSQSKQQQIVPQQPLSSAMYIMQLSIGTKNYVDKLVVR